MGRLIETAVEAEHGIFLKLWRMYVVNDDQSPVFMGNMLRCVIRANTDNTPKSIKKEIVKFLSREHVLRNQMLVFQPLLRPLIVRL